MQQNTIPGDFLKALKISLIGAVEEVDKVFTLGV